MKYDELLSEANRNNIDVDEDFHFKGQTKGLYIDKNIALSSNLHTDAERSCILAEELGHHYTTYGNITDMNLIQNNKQEFRARLWAYNRLVGLCGILTCYKSGCHNLYEMAECLGITEEFLSDALKCYENKYGKCTTVDNYMIFFDPLGVFELYT